MHAAEVQHRPAELLSLRVGYNLVVDGVVVYIGSNAEGYGISLTKIDAVVESGIILVGTLRSQTAVTGICIIEVVERGHTETALGESVKGQPPQGNSDEDRGRQPSYVGTVVRC